MKKAVITILVLLVALLPAFTKPAAKFPIKFTQPDGSSVLLTRHGDEWHHYLTDQSGRVVALDEDGYYRAVSSVKQAQARIAGRNRQARAASYRSAMKAKEHIAIGQKRFLVILVSYSDLDFKIGDDANPVFTALLNEEGYSGYKSTGSARDFYFDNSHGVFEPIFDVYGPVKLSKSKSYYGGNDNQGNDKNPEKMVVDACKALDSEIDFSVYDHDKDGDVDLVYIVYAGYGEADSSDKDSVWPHQWFLSAAGTSLTLDGTRIDRYACSNEYSQYNSTIEGIGGICHEFGHAMGLPDFYDTDYTENGNAGGLYDYSLMCGGSYNNQSRTPPYLNTVERYMLGWIDESVMADFPAAGGTVTLAPVDENCAYKTPTDQEGEYFLYECRAKTGWDKHIPSAGLIVYHIDKSERKISIGSYSVSCLDLWQNWEAYNAINENGSHPCFYIVPGKKPTNLNYTGSDATYYPFGISSATSSFTPNSWNGVDGDIYLTNISYSANVVTMKVNVPDPSLDYCTIYNPGNGKYTAGSVFTLKLNHAKTEAASVVWTVDGVVTDAISFTLSQGNHTIDALVTDEEGKSYTASLELVAE